MVTRGDVSERLRHTSPYPLCHLRMPPNTVVVTAVAQLTVLIVLQGFFSNAPVAAPSWEKSVVSKSATAHGSNGHAQQQV